MEPSVFKEKLLEKINSRTSEIYQPPIEGCTEQEITALEREHPGRFPEIYKIFLRLVGKKVGNPLYERAFCVGNLNRMREIAIELTDAPISEYKLHPTHVIFFAVRGFFATFSSKSSMKKDDPLVMSMRENHFLPASEGLLASFILSDFKSRYQGED